MEEDLRSVLKKAVLAESYGAGPVGGKGLLKRKGALKNKMKSGDGELVKLVRGIIKSEMGGGFMKHAMDYGGCDHCCGSGAVGGTLGGKAEYREVCKKIRSKSAPNKQLFPYHAAQKALKGIKFANATRRKLELSELASMFNPELSVAKNAKLMREYVVDDLLPVLESEGMIKSIA